MKAFESGSIGKAKEELNEGISLLNNRPKLVKLAEKSQFGWATAQEYVVDDLADDEAVVPKVDSPKHFQRLRFVFSVRKESSLGQFLPLQRENLVVRIKIMIFRFWISVNLTSQSKASKILLVFQESCAQISRFSVMQLELQSLYLSLLRMLQNSSSGIAPTVLD